MLESKSPTNTRAVAGVLEPTENENVSGKKASVGPKTTQKLNAQPPKTPPGTVLDVTAAADANCVTPAVALPK